MDAGPMFPLGETIIYKEGSTQTYTYVGRLGGTGSHLVQPTGHAGKGIFYKLDHPEDYVKYVAPPEKGQTWRKRTEGGLIFVETHGDGFVVYSFAVSTPTPSYYVRTLANFTATFELVESG